MGLNNFMEAYVTDPGREGCRSFLRLLAPTPSMLEVVPGTAAGDQAVCLMILVPQVNLYRLV